MGEKGEKGEKREKREDRLHNYILTLNGAGGLV